MPLAAYLVLLGLVNLRRRPFVTSGGNDLAALAVALSGLVLIGPIALFRPDAVVAQYGNYAWLFLIAFYWLWVSLAVLLSRPRLVVYNMSAEQLHPVLAKLSTQLDRESRWAGVNLTIPACGVQLHLDSVPLMRNVTLASSGSRQNLEGWHRLGRALSKELEHETVTPNPRAFGMFLAGGLLMIASLVQMLGNPTELAIAMREVFEY